MTTTVSQTDEKRSSAPSDAITRPISDYARRIRERMERTFSVYPPTGDLGWCLIEVARVGTRRIWTEAQVVHVEGEWVQLYLHCKHYVRHESELVGMRISAPSDVLENQCNWRTK
jgi:hypothetical protein